MSDYISLLKRAYSPFSKDPQDRSPEDFGTLLDLLAEDAIFQVACPPETPIYGNGFHGRESVITYLTQQAPEIVEGLVLDRPVEYVSNGNRVVVLGSESFRLKQMGIDIRNKEFATVIDFDSGLIKRIFHIEDMSEFIDAYRDR